LTQHHILVAADLTPASIAQLQASDNITVTSVPPKTSNVRQALQDATAIITRGDFKLDAPLLMLDPPLFMLAFPLFVPELLLSICCAFNSPPKHKSAVSPTDQNNLL